VEIDRALQYDANRPSLVATMVGGLNANTMRGATISVTGDTMLRQGSRIYFSPFRAVIAGPSFVLGSLASFERAR
jgi:hypothetical protein